MQTALGLYIVRSQDFILFILYIIFEHYLVCKERARQAQASMMHSMHGPLDSPDTLGWRLFASCLGMGMVYLCLCETFNSNIYIFTPREMQQANR